MHPACRAWGARRATSAASLCLAPCRHTQARPCWASSALQAQGDMVTESVRVAGG